MGPQIYFNEIEPFAAAWLGNLYPAATVDQRSIDDVQPNDVSGFTRGHFFAGIAGWELALDFAGWPTDRPVWTGSCPCQPFSAAGKQEGAADERHLWPAWYGLIRECRPPVIFGEQVPRAIAHGWLDAVFTDLEAEGYACGAVVLGACGVGAPHRRQRLYWVADCAGGQQWRVRERGQGDGRVELPIGGHGAAFGVGLADPEIAGLQERERQRAAGYSRPERDGSHDGMANAANSHGGRGERGEEAGARPNGQRGRESSGGGSDVGLADRDGPGRARACADGDGSNAGADRRDHALGRGDIDPWRDAEWIACRDGKYRPTQPGLRPLASGVPGRVGRLRAYGNAIVPQVAAAFIAAYMDARGIA